MQGTEAAGTEKHQLSSKTGEVFNRHGKKR
jgi:hypothetical protein